MNTYVKRFVRRYGKQLSSIANATATILSRSCRTILYEPKEPEGFMEFVNLEKNSNAKEK